MCKSSITEIIHPTQFRSNYHKATVNLAYTVLWIRKRQEKYLEAYDLTWTQFNVLSLLREHFPYTTTRKSFGERLPHVLINPYRPLKTLRSKKLIEYYPRALNIKDRGYLISKKGLILLTRIDKRIANFDKITANISPEEAESLSLLLDKVRG